MINELFDNPTTGAVLSECGAYRYSLFRIWEPNKPTVAFVGLNPSTADAKADDPTIRRCIGFARAWGYGGLYMVNLFAYRATLPSNMKAAAEPIGEHCDYYLIETAKKVDKVIFAWGGDGGFKSRDKEVIKMLPSAYCLGKTAGGAPKHPLYLKKDTVLIPF